MQIQEPDLSCAVAVDETSTEEKESVGSKDEMEMEPLPLSMKRLQEYAGENFHCEGPWLNAGHFRFRCEMELEQEPLPVCRQQQADAADGSCCNRHEENDPVQERSSRRRQQQADAADGYRCKRTRGNDQGQKQQADAPDGYCCKRTRGNDRGQERWDDARCQRLATSERLQVFMGPTPETVPLQDQEHQWEEEMMAAVLKMKADTNAADSSCCKRPRGNRERRNDAQPSAALESLEGLMDTTEKLQEPQDQESLPTLITVKEKEVMEAVLQMRFDMECGTLMHEALLKKLHELKLRYEREFEACHVGRVVSKFALPFLKRWFLGWKEAMEKRKPAPAVHKRYYFSLSSEEAIEKGDEEPAVYRETIASWKELLWPDQRVMSLDAGPYTKLVAEVVLPVMRRYVVNSRDMVNCPDFIVPWVPLLPKSVLEALLIQAVVPKLLAIIDSFHDYGNEMDLSSPLWRLVEPWWPVITKKAEEKARREIIRVGAFNVLFAFRHVLDLAVWEDLAIGYTIPGLKVQLQNIDFNRDVLDPAALEDIAIRYTIPRKVELQDIEIDRDADQLSEYNYFQLKLFNDVLVKAAAIVPLHLEVRLLESHFFPSWFDELFEWLNSEEADLNQVARWYQRWTGLFDCNLRLHERIQKLLTVALNMMLQAANGEAVKEPLFLHNRSAIPALGNPHYFYHLSFKECIEEYAIAHNLHFIPEFGKFHDGLPIYFFGDVRVCLYTRKRVVYAEVRQGGVTIWKSVNLTYLLNMNK